MHSARDTSPGASPVQRDQAIANGSIAHNLGIVTGERPNTEEQTQLDRYGSTAAG